MLYFAQLVAATAVTVGPASAETMPVCITDRVGVHPSALNVFKAELTGIARFQPEGSSQCVRVTIRTTPPSRYPGALGVAHRSGDRILPSIEIYTWPITRTLDKEMNGTALGRAMARVLAHELTHYWRQRADHDRHGMLRAAYNRTDLTSALKPVVH